MGQRVAQFHLYTMNDGKWEEVVNGTTVGYQRILQFPKVESLQLRFVVDKSRAEPLISYFGLYMDPFSIFSSLPDMTSNISSKSFFNGSQVLHQVIYNESQVGNL